MFMIKKHWILLLHVVKRLSGYKQGNSSFLSPSFARNVGFTLKGCALVLQFQSLLKDQSQTKVEEWLLCYTQQYHTQVARNAELCLKRKRRFNKKKLPIEKDVELLNTYLKDTVEINTNILEKGFKAQAWKQLGKAILVMILVFNRRRVGDMEDITLEDLEHKHEIDKTADYYNTLTTLEKGLGNYFYRVPLEGKNVRDLYILIPKKLFSSLEFFLSFRSEAGVHEDNQYVFGVNDRTFSGLQALDSFGIKCSASNPSSLKSSLLRKSIATFSQLLHLNQTEMHNLADFMGHNFNIHSNYYRLPSEVTHLCHLSKLLVALDQN